MKNIQKGGGIPRPFGKLLNLREEPEGDCSRREEPEDRRIDRIH